MGYPQSISSKIKPFDSIGLEVFNQLFQIWPMVTIWNPLDMATLLIDRWQIIILPGEHGHILGAMQPSARYFLEGERDDFEKTPHSPGQNCSVVNQVSE